MLFLVSNIFISATFSRVSTGLFRWLFLAGQFEQLVFQHFGGYFGKSELMLGDFMVEEKYFISKLLIRQDGCLRKKKLIL